MKRRRTTMLLKLLTLCACASLCFAGPRKMSQKKIRPCFLYDHKCIMKNLAANSKCKPKTRPVERQYRVDRHRFEAPHFNASYIDKNLTITGQEKCFVSEFYIYEHSNSALLGIDCPWLNIASDRVVLQHKPLQDDDVYNYKINGTYRLIRMTMYLQKYSSVDICNAFTFTYVKNLPTFRIDPKDRSTKQFLSKDLSMVNIFERETFLYRGILLARTFVNSRLCDFGCN